MTYDRVVVVVSVKNSKFNDASLGISEKRKVFLKKHENGRVFFFEMGQKKLIPETHGKKHAKKTFFGRLLSALLLYLFHIFFSNIPLSF